MEKKYYRSFGDACIQQFGRKLYRVALDAGMTCPNRDGTLSSGGCIFCGEGGSGDFAIPYHGQRLHVEDLIYNHQNAPEGDYIGYFQSYTNTYAPIDTLRKLFTAALSDPLFAGISIATRPDCIHEDTLSLLQELNQQFPEKFIWVELGLQSIHEKIAQFIHRGYCLEVYDRCVKRLHAIGIEVTTHIILGLPYETEEMLYETIRHLNAVHTDGIKLQLLHYLKHTRLGMLYEQNPTQFEVLSLDTYVREIVHCIGLLDPSIVVHRLTGDGNKEELLAPLWSLNKRNVLNQIRHVLAVNGIVQGCFKDEKI